MEKKGEHLSFQNQKKKRGIKRKKKKGGGNRWKSAVMGILERKGNENPVRTAPGCSVDDGKEPPDTIVIQLGKCGKKGGKKRVLLAKRSIRSSRGKRRKDLTQGGQTFTPIMKNGGEARREKEKSPWSTERSFEHEGEEGSLKTADGRSCNKKICGKKDDKKSEEKKSQREMQRRLREGIGRGKSEIQKRPWLTPKRRV